MALAHLITAAILAIQDPACTYHTVRRTPETTYRIEYDANNNTFALDTLRVEVKKPYAFSFQNPAVCKRFDAAVAKYKALYLQEKKELLSDEEALFIGSLLADNVLTGKIDAQGVLFFERKLNVQERRLNQNMSSRF